MLSGPFTDIGKMPITGDRIKNIRDSSRVQRTAQEEDSADGKEPLLSLAINNSFVSNYFPF